MNKFVFLTVLACVFVFNLSFANEDNSDKKEWKIAEEFFLHDNFIDALPAYINLYKKDPANYNTSYKIGYCYLIADSRQNISASIDYLKRASENISSNYKNKYSEKQAPVNSLYYLGAAYRFNQEYSKAIEAFTEYRDLMSKSESKTVRGKFIDREIQSCHDALQGIDSERMKVEKILVHDLKDPNVRCPILSFESDRLIFTNGKQNVFPPDINWGVEPSQGPFDGVYSAIRDADGYFGVPKSIDEYLQIPYPYIPVTATADGSELYLIVDKKDNGDIYVSKFIDGEFQKAESVNALNSRKWESHATITADGKRIYFTSLRKGGEGGLDIWYSDRNEEGNWQEPINIGDVINTPYHEEMPYVIRNGNAIYFSSEGHKNTGGFDMFYSNYNDDTKSWSTPVNLGYPFSTVGNDMGYIIENTPIFAFCPVNDNKWRDGVGDCDCISLTDEIAPMLASISGIVQLDPENVELLIRTRIKLMDNLSDTPLAEKLLDETGYYKFDSIQEGSYDIVLSVESLELSRTTVDVPQNTVWDIEGMNMLVSTSEILALNTVAGDTTVIDIDISNNVLTPDNIDRDSSTLYIENILFGFNKYNINPIYYDNLDKLANYLNRNPDAKIEIGGHTDWIGSNQYNYQLSGYRANEVKNYLVSKGNNPENIITQQYGETMHIAANSYYNGEDNPNGRQFNRRDQFRIVEQGTDGLIAVIPLEPNPTNEKYTIQLYALRNKKPINFFTEIDGIKMNVSNDGLCRYFVGEYNSYDEANLAVETLRDMGYDPFITEIKDENTNLMTYWFKPY
jgi:outer membrane protein OmpA-like peptidoglycan-associated protein